jgi:hypothetical protein
MIRPTRMLLAAFVCACANEELGAPSFDGPIGSAVLTPSDNAIFGEPVGFVANSRSGTIVPLDLKYGTLLTDQLGASFLRPRWVATGDERILDQLIVWAPQPDQVVLFSNDIAHEALIEAPYITGFDQEPLVVEPTVFDPIFTDLDGSGGVTISDFEVRRGYTTTEDWTIQYDGAEWWVDGTRSGRQERRPVTGEAYWTDRRELTFTIEGDPQAGDRFEVHTDTGIVEYLFGGAVLGVTRWQDDTGDALLVAVWDGIGSQGTIAVLDLATRAEVGRIELPKGAQPWRFERADDGATVWVADALQGAVYRIAPDLQSPEKSLIQTIEVPGPAVALAHVQEETYDHLFVATAGTNRLEVYDLAEETWLDVNPLDPDGLGIDLRSPVVGMAKTPDPIELGQHASWGGPYEGRVVAVTLVDGSIVLVDAESGCLAKDEKGPYGTLDSDSGFSDSGPVSNPTLLADDATNDIVQVHTCGGVARSELWIITYDQQQGNWAVEALITGEQENRAYEDKRYVSDHGELQFTILAGSLPSTDGDRFIVQTTEGVLRIQSFVSADGTALPFELPAPPTVFQFDAGPTGGGWDELDRRTYALLPITNSDWAIRVRLDAFQTEVLWD